MSCSRSSGGGEALVEASPGACSLPRCVAFCTSVKSGAQARRPDGAGDACEGGRCRFGGAVKRGEAASGEDGGGSCNRFFSRICRRPTKIRRSRRDWIGSRLVDLPLLPRRRVRTQSAGRLESPTSPVVAVEAIVRSPPCRGWVTVRTAAATRELQTASDRPGESAKDGVAERRAPSV